MTEWISVKDRLPDANERDEYLVYWPTRTIGESLLIEPDSIKVFNLSTLKHFRYANVKAYWWDGRLPDPPAEEG